jgi:hypothetical protein
LRGEWEAATDSLFLHGTRQTGERYTDLTQEDARRRDALVSWPKKSAALPTTVTEDVVRELALPLGLVDTKVCAVDETWSALRLVVRLVHRKLTARPRPVA